MKEAFDLIKERLEELKDEPRFLHDFDDYYDGIKGAIEIVSEVEAEYINKSTEHINKSGDCSTGWIPCSERLPETEDDVLVWYRYRMMQGVNIVGVTKRHGIGYYYKPTGSWLIYDGFGLDQNVIAWMPLPEPWKGEQG